MNTLVDDGFFSHHFLAQSAAQGLAPGLQKEWTKC
jgi:hypothetical protein